MTNCKGIAHFTKLGLVVAAGASISGCATGARPDYREGAGLTVLPGAELLNVVTGQEMRSKNTDRISDAPTGRGFGSDGSYYDIGPRGGRGVWKVEGDQLCVAPVRKPSDWACQQIFRDQHGHYYAYSELLPIGGIPPYYEIHFQPIS